MVIEMSHVSSKEDELSHTSDHPSDFYQVIGKVSSELQDNLLVLP